MRQLFRSLPLLVVTCAAIDTLLTRRDASYRENDPALFAQAALLWTVFGLLAIPVAALALRWFERRRPPEDGRAATVRATLVLAFFMASPVLAHGVLDRFTGVGQNVAALLAPLPWLYVAAAVLAFAALLFGLGRLAVRTGPGILAGAVGALAIGVGLLLPFGPGEMPRSAPASGPNILVLVWDTVRAQNLPTWGYERDTATHLASLAERGRVFENARSASRFTFSSHLSMLSGEYPSDHGGRLVDTRYVPGRAPHLAQLLHEAGYRTGAFVGTGVLAGHTNLNFGFEAYGDLVDPPVCDTRAWALVHDVQSLAAKFVPALRFNGRPHWIQDFQRPGAEVLEEALAWIEDADDGRPWFCFVNLYDAHWPYLPEDPGQTGLVRDYDGPMDGFVFRSDEYPPNYEPTAVDNRHLEDLYDAEIAELDSRVAEFLEALDLDAGGTAVLVTSDHGEAFGEAGVYEHDDIYEPQVRVPLLLVEADPDRRGGRESAPVTGVDVAPTVLGLAGLEVPESMTGVDLVRGTLDPQRTILVEDRDHVDPTDIRLAFYEQGWKLVQRGLGAEPDLELYSLAEDPIGQVDIGDLHPDIRERLRTGLTELRARWGGDEADRAAPQGGAGGGDALGALGYTD